MMLKTELQRRPGVESELYLVLPSSPASHRQARLALEDFFAPLLIVGNEKLERTFFIAVGEALSNAIEHSRSSSSIEIFAITELDRAVVWVRDHGQGFVAASASFPDCDSERGRGIPLMKLCSDRFHVESVPHIGTTIRLERYLFR